MGCLDEVTPSVRAIAAFFGAAMTLTELPASPDGLVDQGLALGIRPIDLLLGILQPMLAEVGERWERGELTHEEEAIYTARTTAVIEVLERRRSPAPGPRSRLLLMTAHWNRHVLAARVAAFMLGERGYDVELPSRPGGWGRDPRRPRARAGRGAARFRRGRVISARARRSPGSDR